MQLERLIRSQAIEDLCHRFPSRREQAGDLRLRQSDIPVCPIAELRTKQKTGYPLQKRMAGNAAAI